MAGTPWAGPYGVPDRQPDPPRRVTAACWLMIVGIGLSVVSAVLALAEADHFTDNFAKEVDQNGEQLFSGSMLDLFTTWYRVVLVVQTLIVVGLWLLMAVQNGRGRKWARIVATVFGAINALNFVSGGLSVGMRTSQQQLDLQGPALLAHGTSVVLGGVILALLWNSGSTRYYEESTNFQTAQRLGYRPAPPTPTPTPTPTPGPPPPSGDSNWPR
jgi:hypothetical protein